MMPNGSLMYKKYYFYFLYWKLMICWSVSEHARNEHSWKCYDRDVMKTTYPWVMWRVSFYDSLSSFYNKTHISRHEKAYIPKRHTNFDVVNITIKSKAIQIRSNMSHACVCLFARTTYIWHSKYIFVKTQFDSLFHTCILTICLCYKWCFFFRFFLMYLHKLLRYCEKVKK